MEPKAKFKKWAIGFAGCDGGNPYGAIWFCGIEWSDTGKRERFQFETDSSSPPPGWNDDKRESLFSKRDPYHRNLVKLYKAILRSDEAPRELLKTRELFGASSQTFKLNLYPIPSPKDEELWDRSLYDQTGLPTKSLYRAWCQEYRFPRMKDWVAKYAPRLIVGTGVSHLKEFIMAFAGTDNIFEQPNPLSAGEPPRTAHWLAINEGKTIVVVTPFLGGRHGLNSDALLSEFGGRIASICEEHFQRADWMAKH